MRKFTMIILLATSAIPAMAAAQDEGGRHGRQQQSQESDNNRPAREQRADRPERAQREQARESARMQAPPQQVQIQQQVQVERQVQAERQFQGGRQGREQRDGGGRDWRQGDQGNQDGGRASRGERLQQYREQTDQRRADRGGWPQVQPQVGGQPRVEGGGLVDRRGRYRPVPDINPNTAGQPAPENRDGRIAHRDRRDGSQWTSNWRNDDRYDWRRYRDRHHSTFRIGFYYDPFGYSYRRFGIGSFLYPSYYQSNYWINDPWQYRLPPAYGPYRWVRYHNDALLIDTWNGEVVDVIYGFFW